jgi:hypothetical protein
MKHEKRSARYETDVTIFANSRRALFARRLADAETMVNVNAGRALNPDEISFANAVLTSCSPGIRIDPAARLLMPETDPEGCVPVDADGVVAFLDASRDRLSAIDATSLQPRQIDTLNACHQLKALGIVVGNDGALFSSIEGSDALDTELGIRTAGVTLNLGAAESALIHYAAMPYALIDTIVNALNLVSSDVFVDLGCGRGRILCRVAQRSVKRVVGVECQAALVQSCRDNLEKMRGRRCETLVVPGMIECTAIEDGTVFLTYGPFCAETMRGVLNGLEGTLRRNPRTIRWVIAGNSPTAISDLTSTAAHLRDVSWGDFITLTLGA